MRHKILALILALTGMSWAQTAQTAPSTPQQSTVPADKAKCSCCVAREARFDNHVLFARTGGHATSLLNTSS